MPANEDPASPCSTVSAASPRILADWATASTLIEASDCLDPIGKPEPVGTHPSAHQPAVVNQGATADDGDGKVTDRNTHAGSDGAVDGAPSPVIPEQSAEELADELSTVKAENEQLRAQLDKIHTMLTGQVKLMHDAVRRSLPRSFACPWLLLGAAPSSKCLSTFLCAILQVQHNRANSPELLSNSWSTGALGAWSPNRDLRQQVIDAVSLAFTTPETKLGWLTRTAVTVAGVYVVGKYGKDLQIVHCSKGVVEAAGTTVRNHLSTMKISIGGSAAATQQGLQC